MVEPSASAGCERGEESNGGGVDQDHRVESAANGGQGDPPQLHQDKLQFNSEMVQSGLGNLNRTADGQSFAFLDMSITGTDMESVSSIGNYVHIQRLVLRNNLLCDVSGLGSMVHLTEVDVSQNKISQALQGVPPLPDLRKVDLSSNGVKELGALIQFPRLSYLILNDNFLQHIDNMIGLKFLTTLSIRRNCLVSAAGLETLQTLRELYLDENRIPTLQPLAMLTGLEILTASSNSLKDLSGVQSMERLRKLDVSSNQIPSLENIYHAQKAKCLEEFSIQDNPLEKALHSRLHTVHFLPQITVLNNKKTSAKEKVLGANLHGANAETQRLIRRKWFANGELDDGGGAIPPTSAGMVAWDDEAKCIVSEHMKKNAASGSKAAEQGLSALCAHLASGCSDQLEICIAVWYWIVTHLKPPRCTWQPSASLFESGSKHMEGLVPDLEGMWSERATGLFVEILHTCGLIAAPVSGFCKHKDVWPGERLISHNHCWSAVKINGRWLLLDVAWAAEMRGYTPFFVPPQVFINRCFPLEAHWQLLTDPLSLSSFWKLPMCSIQFMHNGLLLCNPGLKDVKILKEGREGDPTPTFMIKIAAPKKYKLQHRLLDSNHNPVVRNCYSSTFNKVLGKGNNKEHELWTAFPTHGEFYVVVDVLEDLSADFVIKPSEDSKAIQLNIYDAYEGFRLKVIVPPPKPHQPIEGLPEEPFSKILFQAHDTPTVIATGCNLLELVNYCPPSIPN